MSDKIDEALDDLYPLAVAVDHITFEALKNDPQFDTSGYPEYPLNIKRKFDDPNETGEAPGIGDN